MTRPPLISILLPALNAERTLGACLASIRRQVEPRWECLVVDDGSKDRTAELASSIARSDSRFRLLRGSHSGLVGALNRGVAACSGTWIARMDADDLMHRRRLSEQLALLESSPGLAAIGCHVRGFPRRAMGPGDRNYERWLNGMRDAEDVVREAYVECPVAHPTLMIRKDLLARSGYRDCGWPEDYDLVLRLLAEGHRIGVLPRRRLSWRHHAGRLSRTAEAYGLDRFVCCKAAFLAQSFLRHGPHYMLWGYGQTGRALRKALVDHGKHPWRIIDLHPGRLGNSIHGALVIPPEGLRTVRREPLLVSVTGAGPRAEIRAALAALGFCEQRDFLCTA